VPGLLSIALSVGIPHAASYRLVLGIPRRVCAALPLVGWHRGSATYLPVEQAAPNQDDQP
jgi:hypothetical protein